MLALPQNEIFYRWRMPRPRAFRKPPVDSDGAFAPKSKCKVSIADQPNKAERET
jgi:hypothetical protein